MFALGFCRTSMRWKVVFIFATVLLSVLQAQILQNSQTFGDITESVSNAQAAFLILAAPMYPNQGCQIGDPCTQCPYLPKEGDGCSTETYVPIIYCNHITQ